MPTNVSQTLSIRAIQEAVSRHYKVTLAEMLSASRRQRASLPRQIAMLLVRRLTRYSLPKIADAFGRRDHTTVMHAVRRIKTMEDFNPDLADDIAAIEAELRGT